MNLTPLSDLDDGVASVTFHADGQPLHTVSTAPYKFDWLDAEAGTYSIHASASDTRGATTSSDAISVTLYSSEVKGEIEGRQDKTIVGWACSTHLDSAINVHLYLGNAVGADTHAGAYRADQSSEPAIASACQSAGSAYRFRIPITESMLAEHGGKTIHVLGISPVGGSNSVLARSGVFSLPMAPITDPNAVTRRYVYDQHQQLCRVTEPETGHTVMSYDGAGNLAWSAAGLVLPDASATSCAPDRVTAHASGRRVDRSYDARNRLDMLSFPDGNGNQAWSYTPDGLPAQITTFNDGGNTAVTNTYGYNNRRLLTGESQSQTGRAAWTLDYGYNANAHLLSHVYPDGLTIDYAPNALGQPARAGSYASGVSYYPNGAIKQFTYGNGIVHSLIQNARGLPERSQDAYPGKAVLDDSYDYDRNGNVAAISDGLPGGRGDRDMSYDDLDRLTSASSPMFGSVDPLVLYEYDVLDNLRRVKADGQDRTYYYDSTNRLTNIINTILGVTVVGLAYDEQGNLEVKNGQGYGFDFGNRLREVPNKEQYRYDGHGRRVMADHPIAGSIWSQYGQDGVLRFQQDERAGRHADYIYLAGSLVAKRSTTAFASGTITTTYQHTDALGSPVAVTDESRAVIERSEYAPYGELLNRPLSNGPGYTGHVMDAATGLAYMQQRYYDPGIGRFLSVDPVIANGNTGGNLNRYWYANNNPYKFTDPDGRCPVGAEDSVCIESTVSVSKSDAKLDAGGDNYAKSNAARGAVFSDKASSEKLKAVVDAGGKLVPRALSNVSTAESDAGYSAQGDPPDGTKFVMHGHTNKTQFDQEGGLGDSQPALSKYNVPNVTISGDKRVGVREIEGGRLQHRMLRGVMNDKEVRLIQGNLDQAATMYNKMMDGE